MYSITKAQLDQWVDRYHRVEFISDDPISIPHGFNLRQDIEISGLMTALISWGTRKAILKTAHQWMEAMDQAPFDFVMNSSPSDRKRMKAMIYRTFNGEDLLDLLHVLRSVYLGHRSLEELFVPGFNSGGSLGGIVSFRAAMLQHSHHAHFEKHLANPMSGSAAKRINMFLRWMVRKDERGVDFGIWNNIPTSALSIPLDVHSGKTARHWGLLERRQDDWKAVEELDAALRTFDPVDPVKYDFALFGAGVSGGGE